MGWHAARLWVTLNTNKIFVEEPPKRGFLENTENCKKITLRQLLKG
jgi:hypothetical protein